MVIVDWTVYANKFNYPNAVEKLNSQAKQLIFEFVKKLIQWKGGDCQQIHLIGFSLGAHLIGLVGRMTKEESKCSLGTITGKLSD